MPTGSDALHNEKGNSRDLGALEVAESCSKARGAPKAAAN
jgi:hypothetical protein